MKSVILTLVLVFSIIDKCVYSGCPPIENLNKIFCYFYDLQFICKLLPPDLNDPYFYDCEFTGVKTNSANWKNVTYKKTINKTNFEPSYTDLIKNSNFTILQLYYVNTNVMYQIFEMKSSLVTKIDMMALYFIEFMKFNFKNSPIESIDKFIEKVEQIYNDIIKYLKEDNLKFSSKENVNTVKTFNKELITFYEFERSGLWNACLEVDLSSINVD